MSPSLDKYLCKKYPEIFRDRHAPMTQTCMCWGFPGDGWFFLLDSLCASIQSHIDNPPYVRAKTFRNWIGGLWNKVVWNHIIYPITHKCFSCDVCVKYFGWMMYNTRYVPAPIPQVVASQVKEKFGGLRFYHNGGDDNIQGMVHLAEVLSCRICEECGKMNEEVVCTGRGWISTRCMKCRKPDEMDVHLKVQEESKAEMIEAWETAQLEKVVKDLKDLKEEDEPSPSKVQNKKAVKKSSKK